MKNHNTTIGALLPEQEPENPQASAKYRQIVRSMMEHKIHWLIRVVCGLIALTGAIFCVSLLVQIFESMNHTLETIIKLYMGFLLISVLIYSVLAAIVAIRGTIRIGCTPPAVFGALVLAGFFLSLWFFLTFIFPRLIEIMKTESSDPGVVNLWFFGMANLLMMIAFFGVLSVGIVFIIYLLYSQYSHNRRKLLEIELALADLSEKISD
jgi:type II secretory pathway component PulF